MAESVDAEVRLHGHPVGVLTYHQGGSTFRYEDSLTSPDHRVLGQIFEDAPGEIRRVPTGLPPWFANLLPEGALRRYVERELGPGRIGDFRLLSALGTDLPGAVTVHRRGELPDEPEDLGATPPPPDHPLRHSLAGVQLKFSLRADRLTFPASGESDWWIVKLPDRTLPSMPANEFITMMWLRLAGMDVPPPQLTTADATPDLPEGLIESHDKVYLIPRFDRTQDGRIHTEDFAQIADVAPAFKYRESGATYDSLGLIVHRLAGGNGYLEYVRRLAAMVVVGNTDAHLKNWALIYPDGRTPALSPVYDFHSLTVYQTYRYAPLALKLGGEEMPSHITVDHFRTLAQAAGASADATVTTVNKTLQALRDSWAGLRDIAEGFYPALGRHFEQRLDKLPLCQ
ncbi:MAG: type II toxin-antitoxin system HipA family toxin [Micromonosporaceae bacterium]|nr:type II toxin-antitoxin system HipA family toxin [Micromonosporaceae bacterium]